MTVRIGGVAGAGLYTHTFSIDTPTEATVTLGSQSHTYRVEHIDEAGEPLRWSLAWAVDDGPASRLFGIFMRNADDVDSCASSTRSDGWLTVGVGVDPDASRRVCGQPLSEYAGDNVVVKAVSVNGQPVASPVPVPLKEFAAGIADPSLATPSPADPFKDFGKRPVVKVLAPGTAGEMAVGDPARNIAEDLPGLNALPQATIKTPNEAVQALLKRRATLFAFCADSTKSGAVSGEVTFTVGPDGKARTISALGLSKDLTVCIAKRLKALIFEGDAGGTHKVSMAFAPR